MVSRDPRGADAPPDANDSDTVRLLNRFRDGEREAASLLFERHLGRVQELAGMRLGYRNPVRELMDSEDLVQEALIKAYDGLQGVQITRAGQFIDWMARIIVNTVKDAARGARAQKRDVHRRLRVSSPEAELLTRLVAPQPSPSELAMGKEMAERYFSALQEIAERQREAILLRRLVGFSYGEVAECMDLPSEGSARTLVSRGLAAVARVMDQE